ncbi:MAG: glycosyltransferase, partial [Chloroflexi bacterium]|nr:glycosyltransferase [Chloroflexota bacterium]
AMACGTPVVCSAVSSLPEVVGDAAVSLAPDDARAWTAVLKQLAGDPALRAELSRKGIARARLFDWRRAAEQTLAVYRKALQDR